MSRARGDAPPREPRVLSLWYPWSLSYRQKKRGLGQLLTLSPRCRAPGLLPRESGKIIHVRQTFCCGRDGILASEQFSRGVPRAVQERLPRTIRDGQRIRLAKQRDLTFG